MVDVFLADDVLVEIPFEDLPKEHVSSSQVTITSKSSTSKYRLTFDASYAEPFAN